MIHVSHLTVYCHGTSLVIIFSLCVYACNDQALSCDPSSALVGANGDDVIAASLEAHTAIANEITANFEIQAKLLPALVDAHAALAPRRRLIVDLTARRETCASLLHAVPVMSKHSQAPYSWS